MTAVISSEQRQCRNKMRHHFNLNSNFDVTVLAQVPKYIVHLRLETSVFRLYHAQVVRSSPDACLCHAPPVAWPLGRWPSIALLDSAQSPTTRKQFGSGGMYDT
eukprot:scaffold71379_cov20-Prasinocladus_malaysianus.AAC.2